MSGSVAQFEANTTVRRPRIALMWGMLALLFVIYGAANLLRAHGGAWWTVGMVPLWLAGPIMAAVGRNPKVAKLHVSASPEGLTLGDKVVPRTKLSSALLRREGDRTFVLLRGAGPFSASADIEVSSDEEADRLCAALALDAKSTTAEFSVFHNDTRVKRLLVVGIVVAATAMLTGIGVAVAHTMVRPFASVVAFLAFLVVGLPLLIIARTAKLRVGADGMLIRDGLKRRVFFPHDAISDVRTEGTSIVIERPHAEPMRFQVAGERRSNKNKKQTVEEHERQAKSIVWRIEKAREAYRSLAGAAPQGALVLERGRRTTREWVDALRRVGEGEGATFRSALLTRDQLIAIVESTTAAAKERLAAAVALRSKLSDEEKPRLRVAAERCVLPALRERMVRVIDAPSDDAIAAALEEADAEEAATAGAGASR